MILLCGNNDNSTVKSLYFFPLGLAFAKFISGFRKVLKSTGVDYPIVPACNCSTGKIKSQFLLQAIYLRGVKYPQVVQDEIGECEI